MRKKLKALRKNTAGFTFVELLVVIVIMAVLVAATANYLFSQGGSKARDIERKNDMKQVAALLEQFNSSFGEPPNANPKNKNLTTKPMYSECLNISAYKPLMKCFQSIKYAESDGLESLTLDPKEGIMNAEEKHEFRYLYASDNNGWKVCALLENQTDPDLNANYEGKSEDGAEGERLYCLISSNRSLNSITTPLDDGGDDVSFLDE